MSRLVWNNAGERLFEVGVDRGVLYPESGPGVPWNGLISVEEVPTGGTVTPYYLDGVRYMNYLTKEEFAATIEAFTYPDEFAKCDGTNPVANGLFATRQRRESFGLSYRTLLGNDLDGVDHAYKIHLVYNAVASPAQRQNNSINDSLDPSSFSWSIFTKPPSSAAIAPTAHFVIDSRDTPSSLLNEIEDILYGSASTNPRLPSVSELMFIFESYEASVFDAGYLVDTYYNTFDAEVVPTPYTSTIDGGTP